MIRIINLLLLCGVVFSGFELVNQRYQSRIDYTKLAALKNQTYVYDKEYTKLELEEGTFASNLVLQDLAVNKLGLIQVDKNHVIGIK
jgi:cell division protein FtsL